MLGLLFDSSDATDSICSTSRFSSADSERSWRAAAAENRAFVSTLNQVERRVFPFPMPSILNRRAVEKPSRFLSSLSRNLDAQPQQLMPSRSPLSLKRLRGWIGIAWNLSSSDD
jgi:hypothetical protein